MRKLVLKNEFLWPVSRLGIVDLASWLANLPLEGRESRLRTRFIALLAPRLQEISNERKRLLEEYGEKDKEGKLVYIDNDGKETTKAQDGFHLKIKKDKSKEDLDKEFTNYLEEDLILDVSPQSVETIEGVAKIVLDTKEKFFGFMADNYDKWCRAFEKIK